MRQLIIEQLVKEDRFNPNTNNMIFVFGSNEAGRHGAGAARYAYKYKMARLGVGFGLTGNAFAIPTKSPTLRTLPLVIIEQYVDAFIAYARVSPDLNFQVTQIGCGLAGIKKEDIAPMFSLAPENCYFDTAWRDLLPKHSCWGTFP